MLESNWTDALTALFAGATAIFVAVFGWIFTRQQSRNELLLSARIDYYRQIAPDLNRLVTYMMFIGEWRDITPPEVITLKRRLDSVFYVASPLFSTPVTSAYETFMQRCFVPFGNWGEDALIRSSPYRRRLSWQASTPWEPAWGRMFELSEKDPVEGDSLEGLRSAYDGLVSALVTDLNINRARTEYTSAPVVANAGGPPKTVEGAPGMTGPYDDAYDEPR